MQITVREEDILEPVAVIDIGSNSICLLVAVVLRDGSLVQVAKHKDAARLRDEVGPDGLLSPTAEARVAEALERFKLVLANWRVQQLRCVATAAFRAAKNGAEVAARLSEQTGIKVEVIEGVEEAQLAWRGVLGGMADRIKGAVLCADVGGGSTELLLSRNGEVLHAQSIPLGALVVTRTWLGTDPVLPEAVAQARAELRAILDRDLRALRQLPIDIAIGVAGTIQRVARIQQAMAGKVTESVHGLHLSNADVQDVTAAIEAAPTNTERLCVPGMDPSRSDILLGGALIYEQLAQVLSLPGWLVSMDGLRMGVLWDLTAHHAKGRVLGFT